MTLTVTHRAGRYVPDLTADFAIFEEGRRQAISHFASGDAPIDVGFVLDTSRSMRENPKSGAEAVRGLRQRLSHAARAAVAGIGLSFPFANTAGDNDRAVPISSTQTHVAQVLAKAGNETYRSSGPERRQVVVVHPVTEPRIADLVEPHEIVQSIRAAVRHDQAMEGNGETRFAEGTHWLRFTQHAGSSGDDHMPSAV